MIDFQHLPSIGETEGMNLIFDACRANKTRQPRQFGARSVTFTPYAAHHLACVRDAENVIEAMAVVDEFDC